MKYTLLLDSNVVIEAINGDCPAFDRFGRAEFVYFSPIVLGECRAGLRDSRKDRNRLQKLNELISLPNAVCPPLTAATSVSYASIWQYLRDVGRPIPFSDIWIAAHTMELGATLVTRDVHFDGIPGLRVLHAEEA
jgi:tRNA(fMet)-specific endonuclease VapC